MLEHWRSLGRRGGATRKTRLPGGSEQREYWLESREIRPWCFGVETAQSERAIPWMPRVGSPTRSVAGRKLLRGGVGGAEGGSWERRSVLPRLGFLKC
jgi:hypothetical protein